MTYGARLLALYLPQMHPIAENDLWWGKGFTEWTNVARARPLYPGHYQPHVPADLGFYDLRLADSRRAQADLARMAGIEGFLYYHYWFAGRRVLERPFQEVLHSGEPDFPFCLCWANETWTGVWHGASDRILIEQTYPGEADHRAHFETLLPALRDRRHVRVDGKPVFFVYRAEELPNPREALALWRQLAAAAGLPGLHLVGMTATAAWKPDEWGFDAKVALPLLQHRPHVSRRRPLQWARRRYETARGWPTVYDYATFLQRQLPAASLPASTYPCLLHAWDNTPRSGANGIVLTGTGPGAFAPVLRATIEAMQNRPSEHRLVVLKAWNEWAEGNHLEPDLKVGHGYLDAIRAAGAPSARQ